MSVFGARQQFNRWDPQEQMRIAYDTPFSPMEAFATNVTQGFLDSPVAGTIVRDVAIPRGNTAPNPLIPQATPMAGPIAAGVDAAIKLGNDFFRPKQPSISKEQYEGSPNFRKEVPWEPGMTDDRAAALATFYDAKRVRQHFSEKQPVWAFLGQMAGQAFDPINYIPMFGPTVRAATLARAGNIAGHVVLASADAALNTAAADLLTRDARAKFGDDVSWQAMSMDVATAALIGAAFGGVSGGFSAKRTADFAREDRYRAARQDALRFDTAQNSHEALIPLNEGIDGMVTNGHVDLSPNGVAAVERVQGEMVAARDARASELETERVDVAAQVEELRALPDESPQKAPFLARLEQIDAERAAIASERTADQAGQRIELGSRRADPLPEGIDLAAARVGKPEAPREMAEQHGIDLATGEYAERPDVDQLRTEGRISADDEKVFAAADEQFAVEEAYGNTLKAALRCML